MTAFSRLLYRTTLILLLLANCSLFYSLISDWSRIDENDKFFGLLLNLFVAIVTCFFWFFGDIFSIPKIPFASNLHKSKFSIGNRIFEPIFSLCFCLLFCCGFC